MQLNTRSILFNGAGAMLFVGLTFYIVRSFFVTETIPVCSARYPAATEFVLDQGNGPMSPVQLVGMIGASQRGIYRNAKVVKVKGVPSGRALKVALTPDPLDNESATSTGNGIGFLWTPRELTGADKACLSYSVYLPKSFEFGIGGYLPGLYGGKPLSIADRSDGKNGFAQRVVWQNLGRGNLFAQVPGFETRGGAYIATDHFEMPRDRWVAIEQELVLNTPGRENGLARLWIDGKLVAASSKLSFRSKPDLLIEGVQADIGFGSPKRQLGPPKSVNLYLSPMQLQWR